MIGGPEWVPIIVMLVFYVGFPLLVAVALVALIRYLWKKGSE